MLRIRVIPCKYVKGMSNCGSKKIYFGIRKHFTEIIHNFFLGKQTLKPSNIKQTAQWAREVLNRKLYVTKAKNKVLEI